jgi:hypothetical protein
VRRRSREQGDGRPATSRASRDLIGLSQTLKSLRVRPRLAGFEEAKIRTSNMLGIHARRDPELRKRLRERHDF